jgi:hypothetical protein
MHQKHLHHATDQQRVHLTTMDLYLTNHANVRNTNFCTSDGQVLYKSETPGIVIAPNKKTTIYKVIPNDTPEDMGTLPHFLHTRIETHKLTDLQWTDLQSWRLLSFMYSHLRY